MNSQSSNPRRIRSDTETGAYSASVVASGTLVFVSGQGPIVDGEVQQGSIEDQTRLTINNLKSELERAGSGLDQLVKVTVYLADIGDFDRFDTEYRRHVPEPLPARTTVGAALGGIAIEVDCVATAGSGR
ncbi:MAG: RidA family protein [Acidimicrobiaceae bacterium]|nr:RidA family protein [Acidimicrobiaceae bacterium]MCY3650963.1 RidA family protein [Acidimicrobiaceae bacterium]MDE0515117.1 RidA family protein [Acidimicrobiaceae bacterium]MDE0656134.1 RidA family protein [Acidimicrobiaceae bacterium]